jgi:hypothetical protein
LLHEIKEGLAELYPLETFVVTPYIHIIFHSDDLQKALRCTLAYFKNSRMPVTLSFCRLAYFVALEAHHKLSRRIRKEASCNDAGHPNSAYFLSNDRNEKHFKVSKEPTSLLQQFFWTYSPLLMRIILPDEVYPPTYSLGFPKLKHFKYPRETRAKKPTKDGAPARRNRSKSLDPITSTS